jgi:hypothetical protein
MAETARARAWFYTVLTGDGQVTALMGTRLYNGVAPAGDVAYPYGVMQLLSGGNDFILVGGARLWADMLWLVKFVAKGTSTGPLEPLANRADALLHAKSGTVANGVIVECRRERPFELPVYEGGQAYVQLGAEWRVKVQQA